MLLSNVKKMISWKVSVAAIACLAVSGLSGAAVPNTAPDVTYVAAGTFSATPTSGADTLKLAGEPFSITIVANAASVPIQSGPNWALMSPFKMQGTVHSGLLGPTPVNIASTAASILEAIGPAYDIFKTAFPVRVVGIALTIQAQILIPPGSLTKPLIHPFNPVTLTPSNAFVVYSDGSSSTTLGVDSGTLTATIPPPGGNAP